MSANKATERSRPTGLSAKYATPEFNAKEGAAKLEEGNEGKVDVRPESVDKNDVLLKILQQMERMTDRIEGLSDELEEVRSQQKMLDNRAKSQPMNDAIGQSTEAEGINEFHEDTEMPGMNMNQDVACSREMLGLDQTVDLTATTYHDEIQKWKGYELNMDNILNCPLISHPSKEAEKAALKYLNTIRFKENKSTYEKEVLAYNRSEKLPKYDSITSFGDLAIYLNLVLDLKVKYIIPDYTLRTHIKAACNKVDDEDFKKMANLLIKPTKAASSPIRYNTILRSINMKLRRTDKSDIVSTIKRTIESMDDASFILETITVQLEEYLEKEGHKSILVEDWIRIWKHIAASMPEAYKEVYSNMDDMKLTKALRKIGNPSNTITDLEDHTDYNYPSLWTSFKETLYELAPLSSFQAIAKKKGGSKSKTSKGDKTNLTDKKWVCVICGDPHHTYRKCPAKDQLYSKYKIAYKDGQYRDAQGKGYKLEKGENLATKYQLKLDTEARPRNEENKSEQNTGSD